MNIIYTICSFVGGLGAFLIGVKLLSDNVEKLATQKLRALFAKSTKSKLVGVGIGTLTTAIVQSSSLTSVMVVGLVNAGVMTLLQATAVMMGANIGTTITAQIAALQSFNFAKIAIACAGAGIFINLFSKKEKVKYIGEAIAGLGLVFMGLSFMSTAMEAVKNSPALVEIIGSVTSPILLVLVGMLITALVQSSSAVTSIIISMVGAGIVIGNGGNAPLYVILGTNIGTCITALLSAVGSTANGKRASVIHLMFNTFGTIIFFVILSLWTNFNDNILAKVFPEPTTQVAMFHTIFNVVCTMIFLPMSQLFVTLATKLVKDNTDKDIDFQLDHRLLATPTIALNSAHAETISLLNSSVLMLHDSFNDFVNQDSSNISNTLKNIDILENKGQKIGDYLIQISSCDIPHTDETKVNQLHHNIGDVVRIAELAGNITKYTSRAVADKLSFSEQVISQLHEMIALIDKLHNITINLLHHKSNQLIHQADQLEDSIDELRKKLVNDHIIRLNEGTCKVENSRVFFNLVSNLERVGDHLFMIVNAIV